MQPRSITELRSMAQGLGIQLDFSVGAEMLQQQIDLEMLKRIPKPVEPLPVIPVPLHLLATHDKIEATLEPLIKRGLRLTFPTHGTWHVRFGKKEDSGNIKIKIRDILNCAMKVML